MKLGGQSKGLIASSCAFCGEKLGEEPIARGANFYCAEACAFEGARGNTCAPDCHCRTSERPPVEV